MDNNRESEHRLNKLFGDGKGDWIGPIIAFLVILLIVSWAQ